MDVRDRVQLGAFPADGVGDSSRLCVPTYMGMLCLEECLQWCEL